MLAARLYFAKKIAGWHLLVSLLIAIVVAMLVFFVWYPYPLREIMGSFDLFWLLVGVDVVCGPVLTFLLANPKKSRREMFIDLTLVVSIQISAFIFGMYHVYEAKPVVIAFEVDRLRVLSVADIKVDELSQAPEGYQRLPIFGVLRVGTRNSQNGDDTLDSISESIKGYDIGQRPSWWIDYADAKNVMRKISKPIVDIKDKLTEVDKANLEKTIRDIDVSESDLFYLPLTSFRTTDWMAILNKDMTMLTAVHIDVFSLSKK